MDRNLKSLSFSSLTAGIGVGVVIGFILRSKLHKILSKPLHNQMAEQIFGNHRSKPDIRLVIVIRNDLKMGRGKACAQCSHAAIMTYKQLKRQKSLLRSWEQSGETKIVVKVEDEGQLLQVEREAKEVGLITSLIRDAGHTQVEPGSKTCLAVGPGPQQLLDKVTAHLKLY